MTARKRILVLTDWFTPGYRGGGPIRSVSNLVAALSREHDFSVVTHDADDRLSEKYEGIDSDCWVTRPDGVRVYYASARSSVQAVVDGTACDVLYVNALFSTRFSIGPLVRHWIRPRAYRVLVAPRGVLHPGALQIKPVKKRLFLQVLKLTRIPGNIVWQATDEQERHDIARVFGRGLDIRMAPNLPTQEQPPWASVAKQSGAVRLAFTSRVSRKKNIDFFLERLRHAHGEIVFDIYGPQEDLGYLRQCQRIVEGLPSHVRVSFHGPVPHEALQEALGGYHYSVLTTLGENFGHSVFESFLRGKPAILSDKTPWRDLEARAIGWDVPLADTRKFDAVIRACVEMDQATYDRWSRAAWVFANEYRQRPELLEQSRQLFE